MKTILHLFTNLSIVLLFIAATPAVAAAQAHGQHERVEQMRIAFLTHRLNLSTEDAQHFWPVYNNFRVDLALLRKNFFPNDGAEHHLDADRQLEFEQKKLDLKKRYKPIFEQAIGKDKVNLLVTAEDDFRKMLMQTMRNRRENRPGWR